MTEYKPATFYARAFATPSGRATWELLSGDQIIHKMVEAVANKRPSVEAVAIDLLVHMETNLSNDTYKKMVGHMVKQIMGEHGFEVSKKNVRTPNNPLFKTGAYYRLRGQAAREVA